MRKLLDTVYYWTYGNADKPPLLMVHGFTGSHEGFQYIIPQLEKDFHVIVPDLPGFGESPLFDKPWTVDELARHTNDFVRQLGLQQKPYLVSHSLGGLVAASMLSQDPDLFHKKTIFVSPVATKIKWLDSRKLGAVFGALHYNVGKRTGKLGEKLVRSEAISRGATKVIMTAKDFELKKRIQQHHLKNLDYISSIDFYHMLHKDIIRRGVVDYREKLYKFDILIVAGKKDNVTPLKGERMLARELSAKLEIIPGVGHLAHYETPDAISQAVIDFLG